MIKCENVTIKYDGYTAIDKVSFHLEKGDWLGITGENGCGKSTLLKAVLGLEKPKEGKIIRNIKGGVGYVPQLPKVQSDFPASAYEIVLSGFVKKAGLFYTAAQKKEALCKMEGLKIADLKRACFRELSGGQRQRVLIARAFCAGDELLVLDEPCTGLDNESEEIFHDTLSQLHKNGVTILMVSHDSEQLLKHANKILHFNGSKVESTKGESNA